VGQFLMAAVGQFVVAEDTHGPLEAEDDAWP